MKNKFLAILTVGLLTGPLAVNAELVQSSTGVYLTFRHCISGATVCDSIGPSVGSAGGLPGEQAAIANDADPAYGEVGGSAKLTGAPGAAELSANAKSLPATRNGGNSIILQRYTNTGASTETLTFDATLTYNQTVPDENASFPVDGPARSGAFAEMVIFAMNVDSLEAGATAEENVTLLLEGPDESVISGVVGEAGTGRASNETGSGTTTMSSTVTVQPGDSVWLWGILQSLAANGAEVDASMDITLESTTVAVDREN